MANRDYTTEILSKKSRLRGQRWENVLVHLCSLEETTKLLMFLYRKREDIDKIISNDNQLRWLDIENTIAELEQYIPIRSVACIEGYFRLVYADLIDFGDPYRSNTAKVSREKLSIKTVLSLQDNSISIGEFTAHLLPLSSLEDINSTMSQLIGDDFLQLFKEKRESSLVQLALPGFDNFAVLISSIKKTFELRHIHCHEIAATGLPRYKSPGSNQIKEVVEFIWISEEVVSELLSISNS